MSSPQSPSVLRTEIQVTTHGWVSRECAFSLQTARDSTMSQTSVTNGCREQSQCSRQRRHRVGDFHSLEARWSHQPTGWKADIASHPWKTWSATKCLLLPAFVQLIIHASRKLTGTSPKGHRSRKISGLWIIMGFGHAIGAWLRQGEGASEHVRSSMSIS